MKKITDTAVFRMFVIECGNGEDYRYSSAVDYSDKKGLLDDVMVFRMFDF